ncbi:PCI-domain-containing protein [Sistotremastrum suecicum HHB10207 ss-3]|uniref:Eukaryotic translation initiation factor 3 subunit M n=1 Tax=Sistotremastrum suecicum HHB10207 ss-3 TaxID=1314776 RepID=A0A166HQR8_9AGAM|nr:PCI-domain-containing protein [Sistotremastrum suecicum HHB10207 ss-3]
MATDSVSIFSEGTYEEQTQELVNYLARRLPETDRPAFIRPFQDALKSAGDEENHEQRRVVLSLVLEQVTGLGDGNEREIEGFFNLLFSHFILYFPPTPDNEPRYTSLLKVISGQVSLEHLAVQLRILSNLFNAIPRQSHLRLQVAKAILQATSSGEGLAVLQLSNLNVEQWISEWDTTPEEKSQFLKLLSDAYLQLEKRDEAYGLSLRHLQILPSSSPNAQSAAIATVSSALQNPATFNFDPLFKIDSVVQLKDHPILALLRIFLTGDISDYTKFESSHSAFLEESQLSQDVLRRKIRLLTIASLASHHIGGEVAYSEIASAIDVPEESVEKWLIDVIRTGLISGKISQPKRTLRITRSTTRSFERFEWEALEKRLLVWKSSLAGVLDVVNNAGTTHGASATIQAPAAPAPSTVQPQPQTTTVA